MMHEQSNGRGAAWLLAATLFVATAACAPSGGDEGEDEIVPALVTFTLGMGATPLTIEYAGGDVDVGMTIAGLYDIEAEEWGNDQSTTFALETGVLFGSLDVTVSQPLEGDAWDHPRTGTLEITQLSTGDVVLLEVNVGIGGVDLFYDDGGDGLNVLGPFAYTWEELLDLFDSSPAEYERIASLAWSVVELTRERFLIVFEVFVAIFELADFLEDIGPEMRVSVPDGCGSLPGAGNFGDGIFIWHDDDGDGLVDGGDSFSVDLDECWVDSPDRFDHLYNGEFELTDLVHNDSPFAAGADVQFTVLEESATEESGGVYSIVPGADTVTRGDTNVFFD